MLYKAVLVLWLACAIQGERIRIVSSTTPASVDSASVSPPPVKPAAAQTVNRKAKNTVKLPTSSTEAPLSPAPVSLPDADAKPSPEHAPQQPKEDGSKPSNEERTSVNADRGTDTGHARDNSTVTDHGVDHVIDRVVDPISAPIESEPATPTDIDPVPKLQPKTTVALDPSNPTDVGMMKASPTVTQSV